MADERPHGLRRGDVPEEYGFLVAGGGKQETVWAEGHTEDVALMPFEGVEEPAGGGLPEADGVVVTGGGE